VETYSERSWSRLGLVEICGGFGLVSNIKPYVSVSHLKGSFTSLLRVTSKDAVLANILASCSRSDMRFLILFYLLNMVDLSVYMIVLVAVFVRERLQYVGTT